MIWFIVGFVLGSAITWKVRKWFSNYIKSLSADETIESRNKTKN